MSGKKREQTNKVTKEEGKIENLKENKWRLMIKRKGKNEFMNKFGRRRKKEGEKNKKIRDENGKERGKKGDMRTDEKDNIRNEKVSVKW